MSAGVREILVISAPHDVPRFEELPGNGFVGVDIQYASSPDTLAKGFFISAAFIDGSPSVWRSAI